MVFSVSRASSWFFWCIVTPYDFEFEPAQIKPHLLLSWENLEIYPDFVIKMSRLSGFSRSEWVRFVIDFRRERVGNIRSSCALSLCICFIERSYACEKLPNGITRNSGQSAKCSRTEFGANNQAKKKRCKNYFPVLFWKSKLNKLTWFDIFQTFRKYLENK